MKNSKFEYGDYVWIDSWYWDDKFIPQIGIYVSLDDATPPNEIAVFNDYNRREGFWFFRDGEFRLATNKEIESHLIEIMKP
jgi:hypothetical protein